MGFTKRCGESCVVMASRGSSATPSHLALQFGRTIIPTTAMGCVVRHSKLRVPTSALGHVWTAPWQELSDVSAALVGCGHVSGLT